MPGAVRKDDICTGHGCWPPRSNVSASSNVIINTKGAHRVGDGWDSHTCPSIPETHSSVQASGSATVIVNGKSLARIGDAIACGSKNATGSSDVIVG